MMTTAPDANVHALAIEGTFDDCQALVKAMFNHHAFRDRVRLSGVNSINWARIVAQAVYYFTAARRAREPAPQSRLHRADRKFRRRLCRLCRHPHGLAGRPAGGGDQCQRHPGAHLRDRRLRAARRGGDHLAVDGYPGLVEFRAAAVRRLWPRRQARSRADGLARAVAPLRGVVARAQADARAVFRRPRRRAGKRRHHPRLDARGRLLRRSAYRGRPGGGREGDARSRRCRWWCCRPRIRPSFPDAVAAACGVTPALPDWLADLPQRPERVTVLPADQAAVERYVSSASRAAREGAAA